MEAIAFELVMVLIIAWGFISLKSLLEKLEDSDKGALVLVGLFVLMLIYLMILAR